jgi:hypothetical protein
MQAPFVSAGCGFSTGQPKPRRHSVNAVTPSATPMAAPASSRYTGSGARRVLDRSTSTTARPYVGSACTPTPSRRTPVPRWHPGLHTAHGPRRGGSGSRPTAGSRPAGENTARPAPGGCAHPRAARSPARPPAPAARTASVPRPRSAPSTCRHPRSRRRQCAAHPAREQKVGGRRMMYGPALLASPLAACLTGLPQSANQASRDREHIARVLAAAMAGTGVDGGRLASK